MDLGISISLISVRCVALLIDLIEFSHKLMSKIQYVVTRWKTPFGSKERTTYSPFNEKAAVVQIYLKKSPSPNKQKEKRKKETRVAIGAPAYRRTIERRVAALRHLWLVNKGERTSTSPLALGYPLLGPSPSRSGIRLHTVVQPWLSLQRSISP